MKTKTLPLWKCAWCRSQSRCQFESTGFDYPDLAVGDNSLYISWDAGWPGCPTGCNSGREVMRTSLAQIQASSSIGIGYTTPSDSGNGWGDHLSQDTGNEIFWAGHNNTSNIRIFSLMEGSNTYFWQDAASRVGRIRG